MNPFSLFKILRTYKRLNMYEQFGNVLSCLKFSWYWFQLPCDPDGYVKKKRPWQRHFTSQIVLLCCINLILLDSAFTCSKQEVNINYHKIKHHSCVFGICCIYLLDVFEALITRWSGVGKHHAFSLTMYSNITDLTPSSLLQIVWALGIMPLYSSLMSATFFLCQQPGQNAIF